MTKVKKIKFDRDEVYNHYIQNFSDELNNELTYNINNIYYSIL